MNATPILNDRGQQIGWDITDEEAREIGEVSERESEERRAALGYGNPPTEGWSGTDTSRERAETEAADGTAGRRQRTALDRLRLRAEYGMTWKEFASWEGLHHGQASATLSNLHKAHRITRLTERRDRCKVYVLPGFVGDREAERFVPNKGRYPQRGDETEVWIKAWRDRHLDEGVAWATVDIMLDEYRLAADTGRRLSELGDADA
jgi:hypothetical protein